MIKFFRKIRYDLMEKNKKVDYLKYAIGEIFLVVIGILFALQINNWNDLKKQWLTEVHYLKNIKVDLQASVIELNEYIITRIEHINSAKIILDQFYGKRTLAFSEFNSLSLSLYEWEKYYQKNNTFQELINSGNLTLITNDYIKNTLLNIELLYIKLKSEEEHYLFDTKKTFYEPQYKFVDLSILIDNFTYQVTNGESGKNIALSEKMLEEIYESIELKNGFSLSILEYEKMNNQMKEMIKLSENLINMINSEINR